MGISNMADQERRTDRNRGIVSAPEMPDDKWVVGAFVVLMDEDNEFYVYVKDTQDPDAVASPIDEVKIELAALVAQAYQLANIDTNE